MSILLSSIKRSVNPIEKKSPETSPKVGTETQLGGCHTGMFCLVLEKLSCPPGSELRRKISATADPVTLGSSKRRFILLNSRKSRNSIMSSITKLILFMSQESTLRGNTSGYKTRLSEEMKCVGRPTCGEGQAGHSGGSSPSQNNFLPMRRKETGQSAPP